MKIRVLKILLAVLGLFALFATGLAIRRVVLDAQFAQYGRPLPFNMESALEFRYVRMLFETGSIPLFDKAIQAPGGIVVRETYTLGAEYAYAAVARLFPKTMPLDERVRWIAAAWFCLGIPLLSLWLWGWTRSAWAAGIAGAYYAVALAAVIRSTGQELQHENFALPFLVAHWALGAWANRVGRTNSKQQTSCAVFLGLTMLSAAMLACAVAFWDLVQYYVILWALGAYIRFVSGMYWRDARACLAWWLTMLALLGAGWLNPYLCAHAFNASFGMLLAYGVALGLAAGWLFHRMGMAKPAAPPSRSFAKRQRFFWGPLARALVALLPLVAGMLWIQAYGETYGHFMELLWAKIRFLNHKPVDPALLTFNQRILWTAPLNSATFLLTAILFPATLILSVLGGVIAIRHTRAYPDPEINQLLGYTAVSLLAFVFFAKFHVFLVLGFAALLGWLGFWASARRSLLRWMVLVLLLAGVGVEAGHVICHPARWGSVPVYLKEKQELCHWLRANTTGESVLANFGLSAFLLTYAHCPIVLHPKFESPQIRQRVRAYGEKLFKSDENSFRAWIEPFGAPYYVYALGEFADVQPESQMRYCVDALNPPPWAAARLFEKHPEQGRYFQFLWGNAKYRVFRVIMRADELCAGHLAAEAAQDLCRGRKADAENKATQALMYDPQNTNALQVLLRLH